MKFIFPIFVLFLIVSCKKNKVQPLEPYSPNIIPPAECLIVGDSSYHSIYFMSYSPIISLESDNVSEYHNIDVDLDGQADFQFEVWATYPLAGGWFNGCYVKVRSLHADAEISKDSLYMDSSYFYPHQYFENDTLRQEGLWDSNDFYISANGDDPSDSCYGPGCPNVSYGQWFGHSNLYIGIRMYECILGWIKISLPQDNPNWGQILEIEEYGYDL